MPFREQTSRILIVITIFLTAAAIFVVTMPLLALQPETEWCGDNALPAWGICLQGTVWWQPASGTAVALTAVPITVSKGVSQVTGLSALYPGQTTPTYHIDISPLDPAFLQPVTLTANISGTLVTEQVTVYPDFSSQSQQYDLIVSALGSFSDSQLWGAVVDFGSGGPVTGATVTAAYGQQQMTVTTTQSPDAALPIYRFSQADLATIGAATGNVVTLTAQYGADKDVQLHLLGADPAQLNFVTGWKCDDFDPLPDEGSAGFPEEDPPLGGPDIACIWGYGRFDGQPIANMQIQLDVNGVTHESLTQVYPGETLPRYGIGVWGAHVISGTLVTATGTYDGYTASETMTVTLDQQSSQRLDLSLVEAALLNTFSNGNDVNAVVWDGSYLWAGTTGGVVRWNPSNGQYQLFTTANGLVSNHVNALASDGSGTLWVGTADGVSRYNPGATPSWETLTTADGQPHKEVNALAVAADGSLWLGTPGHGVTHYTSGGSPEWEFFTENDGLAHNVVEAIAVGSDGSLWFGTRNGLSHYVPGGSPEWESFTVASGLPHNTVQAIAEAGDGTLWLGTIDGVAHYAPGDTPAWENFAVADGLVGNNIKAIAIAADQTVWFGATGGVSHYLPGTAQWASFTTAHGLAGNKVQALTTGTNGSIWVGTERGLSHHTPGGNPEWESYTTDSNLSNNFVQAIDAAQDGSLWLGMKSGGVARFLPGGNPEWTYFTSVDGLVHNTVQAVLAASDGTVWFGTRGGVSRYTPGGSPEWESFTTADGLSHNSINAIAIGADGSLWFGTSGGVTHFTPGGNPEWETFTTADGLANNGVTAVAAAPDGSLWFGTLRSGVSHYVPGGSPEWETFTTADGLGADGVLSLLATTDNVIWFGTRLGGLSRFVAGGSPEWETFTTADGLAHNTVRAIAAGLDGSYWMGTNMGVSHYSPGLASPWTNYTTADGLTANEIWAVAIGLDGTLWAGTKSGLSQLAVPLYQSDLSVNIAGSATALAGNTISYTLRVANYGEIAAQNSTLTLTLPTGTLLESATPPPSGSAPLTWDLATIPPDGSVAVTVAVTPAGWPTSTNHTAVAAVSASIPESFMTNNAAELVTRLVDPNNADAGVTVSGPPLLIPGTEADFTIFVDNSGGAAATATELVVTLPPELGYVSASMTPTAVLQWDMGTLPAQSAPLPLRLTVAVDNQVTVTGSLPITAVLTTATSDTNPVNNTASASVPTSLADAMTLILVAPERMTARYGTSALMESLYDLARHPMVQGVVLDVAADPAVSDAYASWDADPNSWQRANDVATAIKSLIETYDLAYPNLRYLVLVGGDTMIPFYRLADQNGTVWYEQVYSPYVSAGTATRAALAQDRLLTDDYYAARTPAVPDSPFWLDGHPLYLPDLATGRLVETPAEIITAVAAFFANNGSIRLDPATVGTDTQLAADLGQAQCAALAAAGISVATCTGDSDTYRVSVLNQVTGSTWSAFHSSHFSLGALVASQISDRTQAYTHVLNMTIGCHAGLPVPDSTGLTTDIDLAQAFLGQGGTFIGSTAYTYGSQLSVEYSEALAQAFLTQVLAEDLPVGMALIQAKQSYYAERAGWADYLDEKVLVPVTLYGLPMLQVETP